jgi:hypothetical protein
MLTEASRAVFLSYASQDAQAAQRICEALQASAIEVWFDQSELRGGDAWDLKIRQQIRDCAVHPDHLGAYHRATGRLFPARMEHRRAALAHDRA